MVSQRTHTSRRARLIALSALLTLFTAATLSVTTSGAVAEESAGTTGPEIVVAPASAVSSPNAETLQFEVLLSNPTTREVAAGNVTLWLGSTPITTREQLSAQTDTLASEFLGSIKTPVLAKGVQRRISLTVNRGEATLGLERAGGVYLLTAKYIVNDESALVTSTPMVLGTVSANPLKLTYVVPFVLPTNIDTVPTATELAEVSPRMLQLLDLAEARRATLAVDPRIIAAVRTLGNRAPDAATELVSRFQRTSNTLFLLQFADADPAAQAALGLPELLQPTGFDYLTKDDTTPELTDEEQAQQVAALTLLPNAKMVAWPASGSMNTQAQSWLNAQNVNSFVLDSSNVTASTASVQIGESNALVSDNALSLAATETLSSSAIVKRHAAQSELAAVTAVLASQQQQGVVLAFDRGAIANSTTPEIVFETFDSFAWVQAATEAEQPVGPATLQEGSVSPERLETLQTAIDRTTKIDELAPLLVHPQYLPQYQRVRLMHALSATLDSAAINAEETYAKIAETDKKLMRGVSPVNTESVQLVGTSSEVPVTIRNWLPFAAHVSVNATPTSAAIIVTERSFTLNIGKTSTEKLLVPVQSRVSSGQSAIALEVRDIEGEQIYATQTLPVTLRTALETVIISSFGGAVALLLTFGIWRSVRHRRFLRLQAAEHTNIVVASEKP